MAFTLKSRARHSLTPTNRRAFVTTRQASLDATDRSVAPPEGAFDAGLRPDPFPDRAASLLPGLLAATRTGLTPAGDNELMLDHELHLDLQLWTHLGRKKHRGGLQDLVRATQLEVLTLERLDLLPLGAGRQIRPQTTISLRLTHPLAQRSDGRPISRAICATGRPDSIASRTPRWINSSGYFLGRGIAGGSPDPRTDRPRFEASAKPGLAHAVFLGSVLGIV